jgi:Cu+-exporting ATPase
VLGALRRDDRLTWRDRHLGLVPVAERPQVVTAALDRLAAAVAEQIDLEAVLRLAATAPPMPVGAVPLPSPAAILRKGCGESRGEGGGGSARAEAGTAEPVVSLPPILAEARASAEAAGRTAIAVGWDGAIRAVLVVADTVKPTSAAAVDHLRRLGLRPVLLTGDHEAAARAIAAEVGIDEVIAEVLPEGKVDAVRRLQEEGRVVAMVGDGVNDAAALAQADLGLAMGTGTDVAIEASDLTLVRGDLTAAADAIRLSRRTLRTIQGNLFWAFAYNVAALPLAAAGRLNPLIAGAAMAASSVFVVTNSLRLRRFRPTPSDDGGARRPTEQFTQFSSSGARST